MSKLLTANTKNILIAAGIATAAASLIMWAYLRSSAFTKTLETNLVNQLTGKS